MVSLTSYTNDGSGSCSISGTTENVNACPASSYLEGNDEGVKLMGEQAIKAAMEIKDAIIDTLMDDLADKDDGKAIILEMGLTHNLSLLPSDVREAAKVDCCPESIQDCCRPNEPNMVDPPRNPRDVEKGEMEPLVQKPPPAISTSTPFRAYVTLVASMICLSSVGPSLDLQKGVDASMKIYWRMSGTYMILFPFALKSVVIDGLPKMRATQWFTFLLASWCYAAMCVCFVLALDFTSVGNAVIFANSQSLLLLCGKVLVGDPISFTEGSGALMALHWVYDIPCSCGGGPILTLRKNKL